MSKTSTIKPLGTVLQEAELISSAQIEVALRAQPLSGNLRLGEILAQRGWIKQETADFFADLWPTLVKERSQQPLGQYFQKAALLDEKQIETILSEQTQTQTQLKFGELAVKKGWLKQATVDFFLAYLTSGKPGLWQALTRPRTTSELRQELLNNQRCDSFLLLKLYRQILCKGTVLTDDTPELLELIDLGLVVKQENQIVVSDRVDLSALNIDWVEQELARLRPFSKIRIKLFNLEEKASSPYNLLEEIRAWTGEQFFLTQKVCQLFTESDTFISAGEEAERVEQIIQKNLIRNWQTQPAAEPSQQPPLQFIPTSTAISPYSSRRVAACQQQPRTNRATRPWICHQAGRTLKSRHPHSRNRF
jgi:hypothetical protein